MTVLCGYGRHARKLLADRAIPIGDIDLIVDKNVGNGRNDIADGEMKILSWDAFDMENFRDAEVVIGTTIKYYDEIYGILKRGGYKDEQIFWIDEWLDRYPKGCLHMVLERDYFLNMVRSCKSLPPASVQSAKCFSCREDALHEVPRGGICAEVGVAYGDFSKKIISTVTPSKFYAIDYYPENIGGIWPGDTKLAAYDHSLYKYYENRFEKEIAAGVVEMRKGWSWDVMAGFPDGYFDFIYLDADHSWEGVTRDIEQIEKKIKKGGIIQFNDYTYQSNYGVIPAVNEYVARTGAEVLWYCFATDGFADIAVRAN